MHVEYDTVRDKLSYLCRHIFVDAFKFYEKTTKKSRAWKSSFLSLLFGLDYRPHLSDLSETIRLINSYSQMELIQKEVVKLENLVSDLLLAHILTQLLAFTTKYVI